MRARSESDTKKRRQIVCRTFTSTHFTPLSLPFISYSQLLYSRAPNLQMFLSMSNITWFW